MPTPSPRAKDIFLDAVEVADPGERAVFLDAACAGDAELRRRVEALLTAHERPESLLDRAAVAPVGGGTLPHTPATAPAEGPGARVGPYLLLKPLGEGGMGSVFLAEQSEPVRRRVALKVIKPGMDSRQVIARFEAERQALALMDHPNIARVLDAGTTPAGRPFFVMELVHGVPVTRYCDDARLTPRQRLELFMPVCRAVQHAHQKGIVHRDLKPSNVLVTEVDGKPVPKVIDFGIAKAIDQRLTDHTAFTQLGALVGTPEYMSPEQAGAGPDVDTRTDVYGLGVLLYELLTGTTPIDRDSLRRAALDEVLRRVREEEPPKPSTRLSGTDDRLSSTAAVRATDPGRLVRLVRGDLDWVVMKALEKDRTRRYETAIGLARDIQRHLDGDPVEAGPPSRAYRLKKFARKHRAGLAIVAAFTLVLVAATAVSARQAVRARRAEAVATAQREAALAAKRRADEQAAIAEAVNGFLLDDLLGQSDVEKQIGALEVPDPDIKVRTLLDRAARNVATRFTGQPAVEAAVRDTIGDSYQALGLDRQSLPHLERAFELRRRALGPEHHDTLESQDNLAYTYLLLSRRGEAESLYRATLEARRRLLGPEHPDTLGSRINLAIASRLPEAESLYRATLEAQRRVLGPEHPRTLNTQHNLAMLCWSRGKTAEAVELFRATLEAQRRVRGPEHPRTLLTQNRLGELYLDKGMPAEAEPLLRAGLEASRSVRGPEHFHTLELQCRLASVYRDRGKPAEAERLFTATLEAQRRVLGDEDPQTLGTQHHLALLDYKRGRLADAERLYRATWEARRRVSGPYGEYTLLAQNNLAAVYHARGKLADAEPLFRGTLEAARQGYGPDHPHTLVCRNNLAMLYEAQGRRAEGRSLLRGTLEAARRAFGADRPLTQRDLAERYGAMGYTEVIVLLLPMPPDAAMPNGPAAFAR